MLPMLLELMDKDGSLDPKLLEPFKQQMSQMLLSQDDWITQCGASAAGNGCSYALEDVARSGTDSDRPSTPIAESPQEARATSSPQRYAGTSKVQASSVSSQAAARPSRRRGYRPYSEEEIESLHKGVARHGAGKWKEILRDPDYPFLADGTRTVVDLKDKWRHLNAKRKREQAHPNGTSATASTASTRQVPPSKRPAENPASSSAISSGDAAQRSTSPMNTLSAVQLRRPTPIDADLPDTETLATDARITTSGGASLTRRAQLQLLELPQSQPQPQPHPRRQPQPQQQQQQQQQHQQHHQQQQHQQQQQQFLQQPPQIQIQMQMQQLQLSLVSMANILAKKDEEINNLRHMLAFCAYASHVS
eukprot:COSAG02_NODE_973_length_15536_cov_5.108635_11_plen_363_part_00